MSWKKMVSAELLEKGENVMPNLVWTDLPASYEHEIKHLDWSNCMYETIKPAWSEASK